MLNSSVIYNKLKNHYGNILNIQEKIFRCERIIDGTATGVHFYDCNDKVPEKMEELLRYQDEIIGKDYFKNSGPLQWNYYLTFITSRVIDNKLRKEIEQDINYTRKFVIRDIEIDEFIKVNIELPVKDYKTSTDLTSRWCAKLDSVGLSGVYMEIPRAKVIRAFLSGIPIKSDIVSLTKDSSKPTIIPFIHKLKIENFRPFPKSDEYIFGDVNLIFGPNGVGKTSMFEAIELFFCGKTARNPDKDETNSKFSILFEGNKNYSYFEKKPLTHYLSENLKWYGRPTARKNTLCDSFNLFNFYNSDAAFSLAERKDQDSINEALASLALGEEVNRISPKIELFYNDFNNEYSLIEKQRNKIIYDIKENRVKLNELNKVSSDQIAEISILIEETLGKIKWKEHSLKKVSDVIKTTRKVREIISLLRLIDEKCEWIEKLSINNINKEQVKYSAVINLINERDESFKKNETTVNNLRNKIDILRKELVLFKELRNFIKVDFESLIARINIEEKNQADIKKKLKILGRVEQITFSKLDCDQTLISLQNNILNSLEEIDQENNSLQVKIDILSKQIVDLAQLSASIKSLGLDYLKLSPNVSECPLCHTKLGAGKLRELVLMEDIDVKNNNENLPVLREKAIKLANIKKSLLEKKGIISKFSGLIKDLESIGYNYSNNSLISQTINNIEKEKELLIDRSEVYNELLEELEQLEKQGLDQESFNLLKTEIRLTGRKIKTGNNYDLEKIDSEIDNIKGEIDKFRKEMNNAKKVSEQIAENFNYKIKKMLGITADIEKKIRESIARLKKVEYVSEIITEVGMSIMLSPEIDFRILRDQLNKVESWFEKYSQLKENEKLRDNELRNLKNKRTKMKSEYSDLQRRFKLCGNALKILTDLKEKDTKEKAVKQFIDKNCKNITDIFKKVHAPREFENISFNEYNDSGLTLKRENQRKPALITEISTGQRVALALSIFITLNLKIINGPRFILIDDPIAQVDDLNILSFLDYLREIVASGGRQVFFSTASRKLANLFEMKYKYLGEEKFKRINLTR